MNFLFKRRNHWFLFFIFKKFIIYSFWNLKFSLKSDTLCSWSSLRKFLFFFHQNWNFLEIDTLCLWKYLKSFLHSSSFHHIFLFHHHHHHFIFFKKKQKTIYIYFFWGELTQQLTCYSKKGGLNFWPPFVFVFIFFFFTHPSSLSLIGQECIDPLW